MAFNVKILDGGLSTLLINEFNHPNLESDPLWASRLLLTHPEDVKEAHRRFLEAGCDVIQTCTYQLSMDGLKRNGGMDELKKDGGLDELKKDGGMGELKKDGGIDAVKRDGGMDEEKAAAVMKKALDVAMETRDEFWKEWSKRYKESDRGFPSVVVSVGPQAVFMHDCSEYGGKAVDALSGEQLKQWHRKQLTVFANFTKQQPIIVSFETMSAVREVIAVVQLMQQAFPMLSAWISLTCKNEEVTWHDDKIEDVVNAILLEINNNNNNNINNNNNNNNNNTNNNNKNDKNNSKSNIVGVGINCTKPMYVECLLKKVCRCLHQAGMMDSIGVVLYPNPHNEWIDGEKRWQRLDSSTEWSGHFRKWIQVYKNFRNKNKNDNDNENQKNINDKDNNNKKNNDNIGDELRGGLLLGGCCLVTPEDIRTLKEVVDEALKI